MAPLLQSGHVRVISADEALCCLVAISWSFNVNHLRTRMPLKGRTLPDKRTKSLAEVVKTGISERLRVSFKFPGSIAYWIDTLRDIDS